MGLPEPGQGYSQLRADLGGPDAVEGVFQLHSPARENTELPRRPRGWQSPVLLSLVGEEDVRWDKMRCCEVPKGLSVFTGSPLPPHEAGNPAPRIEALVPQGTSSPVLRGGRRPRPAIHPQGSAEPTSRTCRR